MSAHWDAVLVLAATSGFTIYDGHVPDSPTFPYAVGFTATPDREINSLEHKSNRLDLRFQFNCAGLTAKAAGIVAEGVQAVLLDVTPTVTGWINYPIRFVSGRPAFEDRDVTDPATNLHPLVVVDSYRSSAERA